MPSGTCVGRLAAAAIPLLATLLFTGLVMDGHLSFGGGEKDLLFSVPLIVWSLIHLATSLVLWRRGVPVGRTSAIAAALSTGTVASAGILLYLASWFG